MTFELRLYVAGSAGRSARTIEVVREYCERAALDASVLEVIDVLEQPDRAEADHVLATPTLVRTTPPPPGRLVGDLSRAGDVAAILDDFLNMRPIRPEEPGGTQAPSRGNGQRDQS